MLPPFNEVIPVLPDEDIILAQTHNVRAIIVNELMPAGKLPADSDDRKLLLSTLKDMDSAALGRKRIKVDEKQNNNQEAARGLIAQLLQAAAGKKPYQADVPVERDIPVLDVDIPDPTLVDGETSTAYVQETVDMFRNRMQQLDQ